MKNIHIHLIYIAVIILILLSKCNGNSSSDKVTFETPEMSGKIEYRTVTKHDTVKMPIVKYINGKITYKTVSDSIDYKLLTDATKTIDSFKVANDSLKEQMFIDRTTPMNFAHTVENDTIKIDIFGKYAGKLYGINVDWKVKPVKHQIELKRYMILGGINFNSNTSLDKVGVSPSLYYISPNGTLINAGKDLMCSDCYSFGIGKKIFGYSKIVK